MHIRSYTHYSTANKGLHEELESQNVLMHSDFSTKLKEEERGTIELEASIASVEEEKAQILTAIVEAEQQIMLWEKKIQLTKVRV